MLRRIDQRRLRRRVHVERIAGDERRIGRLQAVRPVDDAVLHAKLLGG